MPVLKTMWPYVASALGAYTGIHRGSSEMMKLMEHYYTMADQQPSEVEPPLSPEPTVAPPVEVPIAEPVPEPSVPSTPSIPEASDTLTREEMMQIISEQSAETQKKFEWMTEKFIEGMGGGMGRELVRGSPDIHIEIPPPPPSGGTVTGEIPFVKKKKKKKKKKPKSQYKTAVGRENSRSAPGQLTQG
jgi:hypothetical protein